MLNKKPSCISSTPTTITVITGNLEYDGDITPAYYQLQYVVSDRIRTHIYTQTPARTDTQIQTETEIDAQYYISIL